MVDTFTVEYNNNRQFEINCFAKGFRSEIKD